MITVVLFPEVRRPENESDHSSSSARGLECIEHLHDAVLRSWGFYPYRSEAGTNKALFLGRKQVPYHIKNTHH
jgi:hypothetical protein